MVQLGQKHESWQILQRKESPRLKLRLSLRMFKIDCVHSRRLLHVIFAVLTGNLTLGCLSAGAWISKYWKLQLNIHYSSIKALLRMEEEQDGGVSRAAFWFPPEQKALADPAGTSRGRWWWTPGRYLRGKTCKPSNIPNTQRKSIEVTRHPVPWWICKRSLHVEFLLKWMNKYSLDPFLVNNKPFLGSLTLGLAMHDG